jgi:KDO2-lipid IV(A) lauroyltransferase
MRFDKRPLIRRVFSYFGRSAWPVRRRWGAFLGWLAPRLLRSRDHTVRRNLELCFPDATQEQREIYARDHFRLLGQSIIDRGVCWFGTPQAIDAMITLNGTEHLDAALQAKRCIILLAPHFIGLDIAGTALSRRVDVIASIYTRQSDPDVDQIVREGRARFDGVHLVDRRDGVRGLIRHLRNGTPVYYLPDMDFGPKGAAFVPFFDVQAATLLTTARLAKSWDAAVLPIVTRLDIETGIYHTDILAPIEDFPGDDTEIEATARLNRLIESWVRPDPAQYYWVHRRFKTAPPGEPGRY